MATMNLIHATVVLVVGLSFHVQGIPTTLHTKPNIHTPTVFTGEVLPSNDTLTRAIALRTDPERIHSEAYCNWKDLIWDNKTPCLPAPANIPKTFPRSHWSITTRHPGTSSIPSEFSLQKCSVKGPPVIVSNMETLCNSVPDRYILSRTKNVAPGDLDQNGCIRKSFRRKESYITIVNCDECQHARFVNMRKTCKKLLNDCIKDKKTDFQQAYYQNSYDPMFGGGVTFLRQIEANTSYEESEKVVDLGGLEMGTTKACRSGDRNRVVEDEFGGSDYTGKMWKKPRECNKAWDVAPDYCRHWMGI